MWFQEGPRDQQIERDRRTGLEQRMVAYFHLERWPVLKNRVGSILVIPSGDRD
jgi:hypothetical protein